MFRTGPATPLPMVSPVKKPQQPNWSGFTKAELIRTIKTLNSRQTKLLNRIATLERMFKDMPPVEVPVNSATAKIMREGETAADLWPWEKTE